MPGRYVSEYWSVHALFALSDDALAPPVHVVGVHGVPVPQLVAFPLAVWLLLVLSVPALLARV